MNEMNNTADDEFDLVAYEPDMLSESKDSDFFSSGFSSFNDDSDTASQQNQEQNLSTGGIVVKLGRTKQRIAIIRTSDRIAFKRCRRKWNWTYSGRGNLRPKVEPAPFWLGSGLHFALEDFHGYKRFDEPGEALEAYHRATARAGLELPSDADELLELGIGMLGYYVDWLKTREPLNTLWISGEPQVEVNFYIDIPKEDLSRAGCTQRVLDQYDRILYSLTLDRVIIDPFNRIWCIDYKSAKQFAWHHLDTDPQITAYLWALSKKYPQYEIGGFLYQQHKKQVAHPPKFLSSTKMFSTSKMQKTTYAMYSSALRDLYGPDKSRWPGPNVEFLSYLELQETGDQDSLIKRDYTERNPEQIQSEYGKILIEISDMLDPELRLYPNPTRECAFDCAFNLACIHMDSKADFGYEIKSKMMSRTAEETNWRKYLQYPSGRADTSSTYY